MERTIVEQCARENLPLPEKIANAPELRFGLALYWQAYCDLSSERPEGFAEVRPIPYLAIRQYAALEDFDEEQTEALPYLIRAMDQVFIDWQKRHGDKQELQRAGGTNGRYRARQR